jgi:hypothetical protein
MSTMSRPLHGEHFLSPEQVAEVVMLRLSTVHELIALGELASMHVLDSGLVVPRAMLPPFEKPTLDVRLTCR